MQNTSATFKAAVISTKRTLAAKAVLQTADATIYNLGPGDIVAGSLSINSKCFDDGIELGATVVSDCSIALNNYDGRWNAIDLDGATLWPYSGLVLPDTTTEYVKLGTFIIDEPGRPYSQIWLQASDRMILLDEPFSAVSLSFPATNLQILQAIGTHCNVPLASSIIGILNAAYSVTERPADDLTCRDVVGMIALMAAGFARTNRDGELEIIQLPNLSGTIVVDMPVGSRYEGFMQLSDAVTITGLTYLDTSEIVQLGTDTYSLQVDQIPLLQENRDTVLASIWEVINGYTYTGYTCPYPGNPAIDPGDSVRHVTMDGKTITSLISSHNFVHGGKSTMEASAKSQTAMSYKGANARRLSTIASKIVAVDTKLTTYQQTQAQFTDLLTQAMGYFTTDELQEDGSTIHYEHDHPLLAESVVIYKKTATTMSWTDDAGAHWYGMSADGNILARVLSVIGIYAEWISAGKLQSADGLSYFDLDTGVLHAKDMIEALGFTGTTAYCGVSMKFVDKLGFMQLTGLYEDFYDPKIFQATHYRAMGTSLGTSWWETDSSFLNIQGALLFNCLGGTPLDIESFVAFKVPDLYLGSSGEHFIRFATAKLRNSTAGHLIISADSGSIYFRPNGDTVTTGQAILDTAGVLSLPVPPKVNGVAINAPTITTISAFSNSWVAASGKQAPAYFVDACGMVHLQGVITGGTLNAAAFTLPTGLRPSNTRYFGGAGNAGSASTYSEIAITSTGQVIVQVGSTTNVALDNIHFYPN